MPAVSEKQRRFMAIQLYKKRNGLNAKVDMSDEQLEHFAQKLKPTATSRSPYRAPKTLSKSWKD